MKHGHSFVGHAAADSPLRTIFPDGLCPLRGPNKREAVLGPIQQRARVYLLDLDACDEEERERLAQFIASQFDAGIAEARKYVASSIEFPIREQNITGVSFPARLVT